MILKNYLKNQILQIKVYLLLEILQMNKKLYYNSLIVIQLKIFQK